LISHSRIAAHRRAFVAAVLAATAVIAAPAAFAQSKESGAKGADAGGKEYPVVMSNMDYGSIPPGLKVGDPISPSTGYQSNAIERITSGAIDPSATSGSRTTGRSRSHRTSIPAGTPSCSPSGRPPR